MKNNLTRCDYCSANEPATVHLVTSGFADIVADLYLHRNSLELCIDNMDCSVTSVEIKYCPFCGRKLKGNK